MGIDLRNTRQADGSERVAIQGRVGKKVIYCTHNLCDATSWYSESSRVVEEVLPETDGLVYTAANAVWVDMSHGKVFDEEALIEDQEIFNSGDPHGYRVVVLSNDVALTEDTAFSPGSGDYSVDYAAGSITFGASQAGKVIKASYSYKDGSGWIMRPLPGRGLHVEKAEMLISHDLDMTDTFCMEVFGYADIFAPHLLTTADPPGPLAPGTQILLERTRYKTLDQILDESADAFPNIPAIGGSRGFTQARHKFAFYYSADRTLWDSLGMYVRICIEGREGFGGERATATFYCVSKTDPGAGKALEILTAE